MAVDYDFCGWATKNDIRCADGRVIKRDAFIGNDGMKVPLVWGHQHGGVGNVLGHMLLENRPEGVYGYGSFNNSSAGQQAREAVLHGDVDSLSIYANHLKQRGADVMHGVIREVSLVLAGANPGAKIEDIIAHSDDDMSAIIFAGETIELSHGEEEEEDMGYMYYEDEEELEHADEEVTIADVFDTLTDEQKDAVYAIVGLALEADDEEDYEEDDEEYYFEGGEEMKHNVFDVEMEEGTTLSHDDLQTIFTDAKRIGSLKDSFLEHADDYGIQGIDWLFPEAHELNNPPEFISRKMDWVSTVMGGVHHTPFSRIKSTFADITEDEARAKGYIKGNLKKEEVFSLLKRQTMPTTIYKKQKLDRDDIIDITDFDVVAWIKKEMRVMLDEEIARAILIGDGRLSSSDDKINEQCIRPIVNDDALFTVRWNVTPGNDSDATAKAIIRNAIKSRKEYKGSGSPTFFTTEDVLTDMLLLEDTIGHKLYANEQALATALRVSKIVTVPVMEGFTDKDNKTVYGIIVNLADYSVGADKGGSINMFDDFDIDYNQQKYLMETRCSGSLVKPFSAIVLRQGTSTGKDSEASTVEKSKVTA